MGVTMHQMGGQPDGSQAMFTAVPQADGSQAMVTAVPQVLVVSSLGANVMQYAVPQMLSPSNMEPMPQQMAMQFVGQGSGQDMCGYIGGPHSLDIAGKVAGKSSNTSGRSINSGGNKVWNFTSRMFISKKRIRIVLVLEAHEGPNAQEKAERLMAATVHLLTPSINLVLMMRLPTRSCNTQ